jgi:hypothetical protein
VEEKQIDAENSSLNSACNSACNSAYVIGILPTNANFKKFRDCATRANHFG